MTLIFYTNLFANMSRIEQLRWDLFSNVIFFSFIDFFCLKNLRQNQLFSFIRQQVSRKCENGLSVLDLQS
jgi:hypothetical protein